MIAAHYNLKRNRECSLVIFLIIASADFHGLLDDRLLIHTHRNIRIFGIHNKVHLLVDFPHYLRIEV